MPRVFPFAERSQARLPDRLAGRARKGPKDSGSKEPKGAKPVADPRSAREPEVERSPEDGLTLGDVGRLLRRRWLVILLPTVAAFGLSVAFVQVVTPRYTAEAKLLLESRDSALTRLQQDRGEIPLPIDEQAVASQVQVVMSRDIAREAIKSLGLVGNPEFDPMVKGVGGLQQVLVMLGLAQNPLDREPVDRVLEKYFDRLLVYPAGKSRILTIEFRSKDPELAARAANTISDLYLSSLAAVKVDTARYASTWLGTNIETLRSRVAEAEGKVEAFRARNGLIGSGGTTSQPLAAQQLAELSTQLTQARAAQADAGAKAKLIREMLKDGRGFEIPDVANNELIRRLVEQRIGLKAQLALEARTLLPQHPRMKELRAQLEGLETQIRAAADRAVRTLENDARIAGSRVESLQAAVDAQRGIVAKANGDEVELRALEREAKAQREQLESYLGRFREAAARDAASAAPADARVVSRAVVPDLPSFPKKLPIVLFATVIAFLFAIGSIVAKALLAGDPPGRGRGRPRRPETEPVPEAPVAAPVLAPALPAAPLPAAASATGTVEPEVAAMPAPLPADPRPSADPIPAAVPVPAFGAPVAPAPLAATPAPIAAAAPAAPRPVAEPAPAPTVPPVEPAPPAETIAVVAPAPTAAPLPFEARYDLDVLVARLDAIETAGGGRRVLLVGTGDEADLDGLARSLGRAAALHGRALLVRLDRPQTDRPGLADLVAGQADFRTVIQPDEGPRLNLIERGRGGPEALVAGRDALGLTLDALGEAYDWVIACLGDGFSDEARPLVSAVSAWMDAVVIASNAEADDPRLVGLFDTAEAAGVPEVIVAQDRVPAEVPSYSLRRSA
ncbi:exopolysaccharide transport family protein [Methylobacterium aquaticum]|uniref:exopolysaccharide transport family protein n=1 Tax=Methylobacterium aquaticum TaxID=270351 RepID=UPI00193303E6|nr:exopolysaccharide transport family protein [Methylobacterium aquaticum]QRE74732.1 polysaccharide biosynthesis tyrosine autokinase [Methylobacterium aquaticum]